MKSIRLILLLACLLPICLVAEEQAEAVATVTLGFVTAITVTAGGSGYSSEPRVTFVGGSGSGAAAKAILSGDKVALIIVQSAGSGYTGAPAVSIEPPPQSLRLGVELVPKITVYGPSGTAAQVEWSTSLGNGVVSEWHLLKTVTMGTAEATVVDLDVGTVPRFYRAVAVQTVPASVGFVFIPAGTFTMGSPTTEKDRDSGETQHSVTLTRGLWMSDHETTQEEYVAVMGSNPSAVGFKGATLPVEHVGWNDAMSYCAKVTQAERAAGRLPVGWEYRLPTEAEWEYACRAGTTSPYAGDLEAIAWYDMNSESRTHAVKTKRANAWGLYDMHGNVWELCLDGYREYLSGSATDPRGSTTGNSRAIRGGGWFNSAGGCRSATRSNHDQPSDRGINIGFRPVLAPVLVL